MALDKETLARLTALKSAPAATKPAQGRSKRSKQRFDRLIRHQTQYAKLAPNELVKHIAVTQACESFGCGSPSYYTMRGSPLCTTHLVFALVYELSANHTSGERSPTHQGADNATPELESISSPLVTSNTNGNNNQELEDDSDGRYL